MAGLGEALVPVAAGSARALAAAASSAVGGQPQESRATEPSSQQSETYLVKIPFCPCLGPRWTVIQDWLHLVLVSGIYASGVCLVAMVLSLVWGSPCNSMACVNRWLSAICLIPSAMYFVEMIRAYDRDLNEKKKHKEDAVNDLITSVNEQVKKMETVATKVAEKANGFAGDRFSDKQHNMTEFLKSVKKFYFSLYDDPDILDVLKGYVTQWFIAFSGTLLDPENSPLMRGMEEQIKRCKTVTEVCDVALGRLEKFVVNIGFQENAPPQIPSRTALGDGPPGGASEYDEEMATVRGSVAESSDGTRSDTPESESRCGITWFRCGRGAAEGCGISPSLCNDTVEINCCCCMLRLLSRTHKILLLAMFGDILLLFFEAVNLRWGNFCLVVVNEISVVSVLACFEQINELAILDKQIQGYKERQKEIEEKTKKAEERWQKIQNLHDIWWYRTMPSLSIMGRVHEELHKLDQAEAAEKLNNPQLTGLRQQEDRKNLLEQMHAGAMCLETRLNNVELPFTEEWKQKQGRQLRRLGEAASTDKHDVQNLLRALPLIHQDWNQLESDPLTGTPPAIQYSPTPSPSGSFHSSSR